MADETTLAQRIQYGKEAKRLLADHLFNGVLNQLVRDALVKLQNSVPGSSEGTMAHASFLGLGQIKDGLRAVENDGTVAEKEAAKNQPKS